MATYSKAVLSGSFDGRGILVATTVSPGTVIHTAPTVPTTYNEIWLYAVNTDSVARTLTIQWGGTTSPDDNINVSVPGSNSGLVLVVPGILLQGETTPWIVRAYADVANKVVIHGYVNVIA